MAIILQLPGPPELPRTRPGLQKATIRNEIAMEINHSEAPRRPSPGATRRPPESPWAENPPVKTNHKKAVRCFYGCFFSQALKKTTVKKPFSGYFFQNNLFCYEHAYRSA